MLEELHWLRNIYNMMDKMNFYSWFDYFINKTRSTKNWSQLVYLSVYTHKKDFFLSQFQSFSMKFWTYISTAVPKFCFGFFGPFWLVSGCFSSIWVLVSTQILYGNCQQTMLEIKVFARFSSRRQPKNFPAKSF